MANISGEWLGTYWQLGMPTRFELTLVQGSSALSGNVLDDGYLGEAQVSGQVVGRRIAFSKHYLSGTQCTVIYTGTISESEDFMQGSWQIGLQDSGTWEAYRHEEQLLSNLSKRVAEKEPAGVVAGFCLLETPIF